MTKQPTLSDVSNILNSSATINENSRRIEESFDNTISRDGSTPNQMEADLDLNNNDLLNVKEVIASSLTLGGQKVTSTATVPYWRSGWTTGTSYKVNDLVRQSGSAYICIEDHVSGTFSTDLSAAKWELFAQQGTAGAGTGDMVGSNNLSDVLNAATSLANIGGQPVNSGLTLLSTKSIATVGADFLQAASATAQRALLGLGTAATKAFGTSVGNLVELVSVGGNAGLPAVDGSQLTSVDKSPDYTTTVTTWTVGTPINLLHGFGQTPSNVQVSFVPKATTDGWETTDELQVGPTYSASGPGIHAGKNSTSVIILPFATFPPRKDGTAFMAAANSTVWSIRVRAWK